MMSSQVKALFVRVFRNTGYILGARVLRRFVTYNYRCFRTRIGLAGLRCSAAYQFLCSLLFGRVAVSVLATIAAIRKQPVP